MSEAVVNKVTPSKMSDTMDYFGGREAFVLLPSPLTTVRIYSAVCEITPDISEVVLGYYKAPNRNLKIRGIEKYARAIEEGRWGVNGEPIIFSHDGLLMDGQNRLEACIRSGRNFFSVVQFGVPYENMDTLNSGIVRATRDVVCLHDIPNSNTVTSAVGHMWRYSKGISKSASKSLAPDETLAMIKATPLLVKYVGKSVHPAIKMGGGAIHGWLWYEFSQINKTYADAFYEKFFSGECLAKNDPRLILRNRIGSVRSGFRRANPWQVIAITIKAWNVYIAGITLSHFKFDSAAELPQIQKTILRDRPD